MFISFQRIKWGEGWKIVNFVFNGWRDILFAWNQVETFCNFEFTNVTNSGKLDPEARSVVSSAKSKEYKSVDFGK